MTGSFFHTVQGAFVCLFVSTVWLRRGSWCCGGTAYLALEIAWRGTTHWTMFLAGGACLCALDALGRLPLPTPLLAGIGAVGVSVLELGTGLACRRLLHVEVWDYSQEWGNLAGLVCPKYTALWFLLCLWVLGMMRFLRGFAAYVARTKA